MTLAEVLTGDHEPYWDDNLIGIRPGLWLLPASQNLYRLDLAAIKSGSGNIAALRNFLEAVEEDNEIDTRPF